MPSPNTDKLAVLIDAENAQASVIGDLLREVARYGTATIKRAYGDWTTTNLNGWRETLHSLAIQPIQQFQYTTGKNATDSALIIDAMDLLHGGRVDGFALCLQIVISRASRPESARQVFRFTVLVNRRRHAHLWQPAISSFTPRFFARPSLNPL